MARLIVVSGPSGAGKTTLVRSLLARRPDLSLSVSATTRPPRPGETDGVGYHFLSLESFERMAASGMFLECAEVHGHRYGTPREPVEQALADGRDVVLEIDVQGARSVRDAIPSTLSIFIEPPSIAVLRTRLKQRATETVEAFEVRMANAEEELAAAAEFDHRVVNDRLEEAVDQVIRILEASDPTGRPTPEERPPL